jgi:predicted transcriptional regulator
MKKSAVVERALEADRERRELELLREGYEEMARHDLAPHREFEHVDSETPLPEHAEK